jgi:hypothetical protein
MSDTDSDPASSTAVGEQAESTSTIAARSDSERNDLFNKKTFDSWSDALRGARKILNKNKDDIATLWYRTNNIHEGDGSFSLRCATCHKAFSMKNTANFWQSHKKTCPDSGIARIRDHARAGEQQPDHLGSSTVEGKFTAWCGDIHAELQRVRRRNLAKSSLRTVNYEESSMHTQPN